VTTSYYYSKNILKKISSKLKFLTVLAGIFLTQLSYAHISEGHERLEKEAYELLKSQLATGNLPSGLDIYNYLVLKGIIKNDDNANSAYPDLDLGRQFLSDRQIFHFMADNRYVVDALRQFNTLETQKQYVLQKALPNCLNMIYTLFREVVDNPEAANKAGRGIYVLMHAIMDSYSSEHTIRDPLTFDLVTIKSWQLSRLYWPKGTKVKDLKQPGRAQTLVFLHTNAGLGDKEWENESGALNRDAIQAVKAVKDLLVTIYSALLNKEKEEMLIKSYISTYFKPKHAIVNSDSFQFENQNILLSYIDGYDNHANILKLDRYPLFSHMLFIQRTLGNQNNSAIGYELGYHVTPRAAFSSTSFLQRLPYGFVIGLNENRNTINRSGFFETLQLKTVAKVGIYLPLRNLVLEPRLGVSVTPFYNEGLHPSIVTGCDLAFNLGRYKHSKRTKRFSVGYEYNKVNFQSFNNLVFKIGFNNWQGRTLKDKAVQEN
jgi:hypothetical protein